MKTTFYVINPLYYLQFLIDAFHSIKFAYTVGLSVISLGGGDIFLMSQDGINFKYDPGCQIKSEAVFNVKQKFKYYCNIIL